MYGWPAQANDKISLPYSPYSLKNRLILSFHKIFKYNTKPNAPVTKYPNTTQKQYLISQNTQTQYKSHYLFQKTTKHYTNVNILNQTSLEH